MKGVASPQYKHGRYSRDLPTLLSSRADEARSNPALLSLADDIAVAEARLASLFADVESGVPGETWKTLRHTMDDFQRAMQTGEMDGMMDSFRAMQDLVQRGARSAAAWQEIRRVWETRAKLVSTEVKTLASLQQMVTTQQLMLYLGAITHAVTTAVKTHADTKSGRAILMDVMAEFERLSSMEARR